MNEQRKCCLIVAGQQGDCVITLNPRTVVAWSLPGVRLTNTCGHRGYWAACWWDYQPDLIQPEVPDLLCSPGWDPNRTLMQYHLQALQFLKTCSNLHMCRLFCRKKKKFKKGCQTWLSLNNLLKHLMDRVTEVWQIHHHSCEHKSELLGLSKSFALSHFFKCSPSSSIQHSWATAWDIVAWRGWPWASTEYPEPELPRPGTPPDLACCGDQTAPNS